MAENSLSPAFVKIESQSAFGPHTMTVPSVPIIPAVGDAAPYFDLRGAAIDVSVSIAVNDFVDILAPLFLSTYHWQSFTVFTQDGVGGSPVPVWSEQLTQVGTSVSTAWSKAAQQTLTFRATDFTSFKTVLLDAPVSLLWDRYVDVSISPALQNLVDYVVADVTWVASRGGGRPNTFLQMSSTLNERLRRAYRMV